MKKNILLVVLMLVVAGNVLAWDPNPVYDPFEILWNAIDVLDNRTNETYMQRRVSDICPSGSSIRAVNEDGTVVCETDDDTIYSAGTGLTLIGTEFSIPSDSITSSMIVDGQVKDADINFNYAGSSSKGGPATDISCSDCVSGADIDESSLGTVPTATSLAANGVNCAAGQYARGVDASGNAEGCTPDDDQPDSDAEVPDSISINNGRLYAPSGVGNVGIGTTSPSAKLDVEVSSGGAATIGSSGNSAIGVYAIAMGYNTNASGWVSTAMGYRTTANGSYSTAMGGYTTASGSDSTAMGYSTTANGYASTAMGQGTTANGYTSTAMGYGTTANGWYSTAMGLTTKALGNRSTAMGDQTTASGYRSTAMGSKIEAAADYSVGIGLDNTPRTITQDNTMAIMGGNVGIGTTSPQSKLSVGGSGVSGAGVYGLGSGGSDRYGGYFSASNSPSNNYGIYSEATGVLGNRYGIYSYGRIGIVGTRDSDHDVQTSGAGVYGAYDEDNYGYLGGYGGSIGVYGKGSSSGGYFETTDTGGGTDYGVRGSATASGGTTHYGGYFTASGGTSNYGVYSYGATNGIIGTRDSPLHTLQASNVGVYGAYDENNFGYLGGSGRGVYGEGSSFGVYGDGSTGVQGIGDNIGVYGTASIYGVYGAYDGSNFGYLGSSLRGVYGKGSWYGVYGEGPYQGVKGVAYGDSGENIGVYAESSSNGSNSAYALYSIVYRVGSGNYWSGYFRDSQLGGTYNGLYADVRTGGAIDLAEYILDNDNTEPGDVVVADPANDESIIKSNKPYDTTVLGIISTEPHMVMGMELVMDEESGEMYEDVSAAQLSLAGRVPVKVTDENGAIQRGDLLTTSSKQGYAMRCDDKLKCIGAILGKALEQHESGDGKIKVLLALQ